jgi:hypothetical protein
VTWVAKSEAKCCFQLILRLVGTGISLGVYEVSENDRKDTTEGPVRGSSFVVYRKTALL